MSPDGRPPGPEGVPLLGNTHQYARDPFTFMSAVGRAYGDVAAFDLAGQRTYMLTNPATVERVLVGRADAFRKPVFGDDAIEDLLGNGLLLSEGADWRRQRDLAGEAFRPQRIAGLADRMVDLTERHIADWKPGDVVDVREELASLTVKIIADAMFGATLDDATTAEIQTALEPLGARFEPDARRFLLPNWLPTDENRAFGDALDTLESILERSSPSGGAATSWATTCCRSCCAPKSAASRRTASSATSSSRCCSRATTRPAWRSRTRSSC